MAETYILFAGSDYYPCGGQDDIDRIFTAESDEQARNGAVQAVRHSDEQWFELLRVCEPRGEVIRYWSIKRELYPEKTQTIREYVKDENGRLVYV